MQNMDDPKSQYSEHRGRILSWPVLGEKAGADHITERTEDHSHLPPPIQHNRAKTCCYPGLKPAGVLDIPTQHKCVVAL